MIETDKQLDRDTDNEVRQRESQLTEAYRKRQKQRPT